MRKFLSLAVFLCASTIAFAQDATLFTAESDHYRVFSETSRSQAEQIAQRMEAALRLYNDVFHFDLSALSTRMRVRVFRDADGFNAYLVSVLSQTRTDFVFIAWSDPEKSELLCFPKEEKSFTASLLHQGCIQFLKAFVANPPIWLREGVATYLDGAVYDAKAGQFTLKPNFLWLDGLKAAFRGETPAGVIPVSDLLTLSREAAQAQLDVFYPEAWGLVHFLITSPDRVYNRIFWDAIGSLDPKGTLEENSLRLRTRAFSWVTDQKFRQDFEAYVLSVKTADDLLRDGVDLYGKADLAKSEDSLTRALELEPENGVAWYYLGLVAYSRKEYAKAEDLYLKSFQFGTSAGVINYALGVNSFASGNSADAVKYLNFSKKSDQATYGDKVDTLLKRISAGK